MNCRERVLTALRHKEPDRVPVDLGGTVCSGIDAVTYCRLRERLNLPPNLTYVGDTYQQQAVIEQDVRHALRSDVCGIYGEPRGWQLGELRDGSPAMVPAKWNPTVQPDGSQVILDSAGNVVMKMPKDGYYFDVVYPPMADADSKTDLDEYMHWAQSFDRPFYLDKSYEELAQQAKDLRENSDCLIAGHFGGQFLGGGQRLRGYSSFFLDLAADPRFACALMDRLLDVYLERFAHYADTLGKYVDVIEVDEDLGMQDGPLLSLDMYRKLIKPRQEKLFRYMKSKCDAYLFMHSCGSVYEFIPDFIEMGVDILNPVQVSAKDMDTKRLKKEFGQDLVFWGGGCDTQQVLPYGTPEQVREEVRQRIDDLAPGGGFVFTPVLNIQPLVPIDNVMAMYETVVEWGTY